MWADVDSHNAGLFEASAQADAGAFVAKHMGQWCQPQGRLLPVLRRVLAPPERVHRHFALGVGVALAPVGVVIVATPWGGLGKMGSRPKVDRLALWGAPLNTPTLGRRRVCTAAWGRAASTVTRETHNPQRPRPVAEVGGWWWRVGSVRLVDEARLTVDVKHEGSRPTVGEVAQWAASLRSGDESLRAFAYAFSVASDSYEEQGGVTT